MNRLIVLLKSMKRKLKQLLRGKRWLESLPTDKLLSLMRHEAHRIEKSFYNGTAEKYPVAYDDKCVSINHIIDIVGERDPSIRNDPTVVWAKDICDSYHDFEKLFIREHSLAPYKHNQEMADNLAESLRNRRSCRVWSDVQPCKSELISVAHKLIDTARWAPTSGNRQPWRFMIFVDDDDKNLFAGIKEKHTVLAPLLIFVGMDKRLYGAFGKGESCIYIDAGAAIENMIMLAQYLGYGTCWNHFGMDFIVTRKSNIKKYKELAEIKGIPSYIEPVAVLAIGMPKFVPPRPERTPVGALILENDKNNIN